MKILYAVIGLPFVVGDDQVIVILSAEFDVDTVVGGSGT
jgi:hypothetical protein